MALERNSTDFPRILATLLGDAAKQWTPEHFLKIYQYIPVQYIMKNADARGLLLAHEKGYGKTILASALMYYLHKEYPSWKIVMLAAKSLEENIKSALSKFGKATNVSTEEINELQSHFKFVTLNSSVMYKKMSEVDKSPEQMKFEEQLHEFKTAISENHDFLEKSILIVDEAHNLFNSITNGSSNAIQLYETIIATKQLKLFFLTGSPMQKSPFELSPCFNMLSETGVILPENLYDFTNFFIDKDKIKNRDIFSNRIVGLTSYAGPIYHDGDPPGFPKLSAIEVIKVPMSEFQWSVYSQARTKEKEMLSFGYLKAKAARQKFGRVEVSSTYRVASRQISDFAFPAHALVEKEHKSIKSVPSKLTEADLTTLLPTYSPKMVAILAEMDKAFAAGEDRMLLFSPFVNSTIDVFARILLARGWEEYTADADMTDKIFDLKNTKKKFARFTGSVEPEHRAIIRNHFNETNDIQLILLSEAGAEGINLLRGRLVILAAPFWYYELIMQVIYRFYRFEGHKDLPPEKQTVRPLMFISTRPNRKMTKEETEIAKEPTTDEYLWEQSLLGKSLIEQFHLVLAESSIDCSVRYPTLPITVQRRVKCKTCASTHATLFHKSVVDDLKFPNPCVIPEEKKIKVHELLVDDQKYYYQIEEGNMKIYYFDPRVRGYVIMPLDNPLYSMIHSKIIETQI